jgi:hypothetical protein
MPSSFLWFTAMEKIMILWSHQGGFLPRLMPVTTFV